LTADPIATPATPHIVDKFAIETARMNDISTRMLFGNKHKE